MVTEGIPAVYENGAFQVSAPLPDLAEHQAVELFYVIVDKPLDSISENGSNNGVEKHFINNRFVDAHPLDEVDDEFIEMFGPPPTTIEERSVFVQKTSGIWAVEDDELLHWLSESPEASVLHDGAYYEFMDTHPLDEVDDEFVEMFGLSPVTVEERIAFLHKISGIWPVENDELREWLDTEVTMYE